MALLDAAAGVGAEPRGTHIEESFAHASLTRVAADALYRAMVPCALRAARLSTPWKAPSHVQTGGISHEEDSKEGKVVMYLLWILDRSRMGARPGHRVCPFSS